MTISMSTLVQIQVFGILLLYLFMTVCIPAAIFGVQMRDKYSFTYRFFAYFVTGNIFIVTLTYILALAKLNNGFAYWFFTILLCVLLYGKTHGIKLKDAFERTVYSTQVVATGAIGPKTLVHNILKNIGFQFRAAGRWIVRVIFKNIIEWICLLAALTFVGYRFAANFITNWGWMTSDMPVHAFWVNSIANGKVFVSGIYPFGYHCLLYYFYQMFGIDSYVMLRVFGFSIVMLIILGTYGFMHYLCKSRFLPIITIVAWMGLNIWEPDNFTRYYSSLPQEFGMIFLFPSFIFVFEFFRQQRKLPKEKGMWKKWDESKRSLVFFAFGFSLALSGHFYITIVQGFLIIGIVIAFFWDLFKPRYFVPIMLSGFLALFLSIAPMLYAGLVLKTPLEGSLRWGMSVMKGTVDDPDSGSADKAKEKKEKKQKKSEKEANFDTDGDMVADAYVEDLASVGNVVEVNTSDGRVFYMSMSETDTAMTDNVDAMGDKDDKSESQKGESSAGVSDSSSSGSGAGNAAPAAQTKPKKTSKIQKIVQKFKNLPRTFIFVREATDKRMQGSLLSPASKDVGVFEDLNYWIWVAMVVCAGVGLLCVLGDSVYGRAMIAFAIFAGLCMAMTISDNLGIPQLIESYRARIFATQAYCMLVVFAVDACLAITLGWFKRTTIPINFAGLLVLGGFVYICYTHNAYILEPYYYNALETNGAITCITNIIENNAPQTYTIVSANDEIHMIELHGFHYELGRMLTDIEKVSSYSKITIPTEKIYFFIEKVPIDYGSDYEGSGQAVSAIGAAKPLPDTNYSSAYQRENRWILMSKMYYWAKAFQQQYPNEMYVFYEDDQFICYCLNQDPYCLFNLSLYYGFNKKEVIDLKSILSGEN